MSKYIISIEYNLPDELDDFIKKKFSEDIHKDVAKWDNRVEWLNGKLDSNYFIGFLPEDDNEKST